MANKQQTLANGRKTTDNMDGNMDNGAPRTHACNSATKSEMHPKRTTREPTKPIRISRLSNQNDKNAKSENAKRSEPNIGQIPGRAGPLHSSSPQYIFNGASAYGTIADIEAI